MKFYMYDCQCFSFFTWSILVITALFFLIFCIHYRPPPPVHMSKICKMLGCSTPTGFWKNTRISKFTFSSSSLASSPSSSAEASTTSSILLPSSSLCSHHNWSHSYPTTTTTTPHPHPHTHTHWHSRNKHTLINNYDS